MNFDFVSVSTKELKIGLGEAITRLNNLHTRITMGISTTEEKSEYSLLLEALNEIQINLGFDCNNDGVPDTIDIFTESASNGCCRLLPSSKTQSRRKSNSRRK